MTITDNFFDVVGQYEAFVVVTFIDADVARKALPGDFELAPPDGTPAGKHPVMYSFGKHRHVHPPSMKLYEYDYDEALIGLPHVGIRKNGTLEGNLFHMIDVRLNNEAAEGIGRTLGFPKQMATIDNQDTTYAIATGSKRILTAKMELSGKKFKDNHCNFKVISPLMQQAAISRAMSGTIVATHFSIDTANAFMVPAKMTLEVADDSLAGLPRGTHHFDTIDTAAFGGAYLSIHSWRMSPKPRVFV